MASKYDVGEQLTSLDELAKQELVYFVKNDYKKVYHSGWFLSWQFRKVKYDLQTGSLYKVIEEKENNL